MIISKRKLKIESVSQVASLEERKKGRILGVGQLEALRSRFTEERIMTVGEEEGGEFIAERNAEPIDLFRYMMGAFMHKVEKIISSPRGPEQSTKLQNAFEIDPADFTIGKLFGNDTIAINLSARQKYRIPFSRILIDNEEVTSSSADIIRRTNARIEVHFWDLDWLHVFFSQDTVKEFFRRGTLEGPFISAAIQETRDWAGDRERRVSMHAENTMKEMGMPWMQTKYPLPGRTVAPHSSYRIKQFSVDTEAPVSETLIRRKGDEVSTMKFLIGEDYNFFIENYEQSVRSPANKEFDLLPDVLLPSSYGLSCLMKLADMWENTTDPEERRTIGARALSFMRNFDLNNNIDDDITIGQSSLTHRYFNDYSLFVKTGFTDAVLEELQPLIDKMRNVIVDTTVVNNNPNKSQFPFFNEITLVDAGRTNVGFITRDLTDPGKSFLFPRASLRLASLSDGSTMEEMETEISLATRYDRPGWLRSSGNHLRFQHFAIEDSYADDPANVSEHELKLIPYDVFLSSLLTNTNIVFNALPGDNLEFKRRHQQELVEEQFRQYTARTENPFTFEEISNSNADLADAISFLTSLFTMIRTKSEAYNFSIKDLLLSRKNYKEIIAYKIKKTNLKTGRSQNFFLTNTPGQMNQFVDSQIKYGQEYTYEAYAYALVFGHAYRYVTSDLGESEGSNPQSYLHFCTDVRMSEDLQILEIPVVFENSVTVDAPPIKPSVEFFPLKDSKSEIRIRLSSMGGTEIVKPIEINRDDREIFNRIQRTQKRQDGKIFFRTDELPLAFEVYRLTEMPRDVRDFAPTKRTVLCATENLLTNGVLVADTVVPNVDYYYLFRTLDNHGNISNPTEIFKFTLSNQEGALIPLLDTIPLSQIGENRNVTKPFRKFLQLQPSLRQKQLGRNQFRNKSSADITSLRYGVGSVLEQGAETGIQNKSVLDTNFLIEIRSKNTGKILYLEVNYNPNNSLLDSSISAPRQVSDANVEAVTDPQREIRPARRQERIPPPRRGGKIAYTPGNRLPGTPDPNAPSSRTLTVDPTRRVARDSFSASEPTPAAPPVLKTGKSY
jgi:hypothetical protein